VCGETELDLLQVQPGIWDELENPVDESGESLHVQLGPLLIGKVGL
jgi:hypothetical protein